VISGRTQQRIRSPQPAGRATEPAAEGQDTFDVTDGVNQGLGNGGGRCPVIVTTPGDDLFEGIRVEREIPPVTLLILTSRIWLRMSLPVRGLERRTGHPQPKPIAVAGAASLPLDSSTAWRTAGRKA
jgi:hypothetical protein